MPLTRALTVFLTILALASACGSSNTSSVEMPRSVEVVPAQTAGTTNSRASTPDAAPNSARGRCASNRENAGAYFEYSLGESRSEAEDAFCGRAVLWHVEDETDTLTGTRILSARAEASSYESADQTYGEFDPALVILCASSSSRSNLLITAMFGRGLLIDSGGIRVIYKFNDGELIESLWLEDSGIEFAGAHLPPSNTGELRRFLNLLSDEGKFTIRAWDSQDRVAGTLTFDLHGVSSHVEPVLNECGY